MLDWIINNKEWVFSGIGIFFIGIIISLIKYFSQRKKKNEPQRTIDFNGDKSLYIEKNEGEINIK